MSGAFVHVLHLQKSVLAGCSGSALDELTAVFRVPSFFLQYSHLGFHTGVDKESWSAAFLLSALAALQLVTQLEQRHSVSLRQARGMVSAADEGKYLSVQAVSIPTDTVYKAILKSFPKLVKQSKSQMRAPAVLYDESHRMLATATQMARPLPEPSTATALQRSGRADGAACRTCGPAVMFLSLDFEWWERSQDVILEVGWSLWDSLTQQHRTRHWLIKEHLNKANGRFISDNRMRFLFGSSERGSMDRAMTALQAEVDAAGISEGLDRQQKEALTAAGVELVLVGHGMNSDVEIAEMYDIEWPQSMQILDTQRLYMAWQLRQLDAAAAAKALGAVAAGGKNGSKAAAGLDDELHEHDNDGCVDDDAAGWADDARPYEDDEGRVKPAAVAAAEAAGKGLAAMSLGKGQCWSAAGGGSGSGTSSPGGKAARKGPVQVQNPPRVRPWPAGPPPGDPNRPASSEQQQQQHQQSDQAVKVESQVSLAGLLSALGIKFGKLHNAGNDARYTMEAFLAIAGHPPCSDPLQAHLDFASQDAHYQRQIEASMAAAAALGWATPSNPSPGPSAPAGGASGPQSSSKDDSGGAGVFQGAATGSGSRPGCSGGAGSGAGRDSAWQGNGRQQQHGGAWGAAAATAASKASLGHAGGAVPSAGGAWGQGKQGGGLAAPGGNSWGVAPQQQQQQQQKSNAVRGAFNSTVDTGRKAVVYEPNPDGW